MKKNDLKFLVNLLLFIDVSSIAAIGLLMAFVIPRGQGYAGNSFMGLSRHAWGDAHLNLSLLLLALLSLHLWFNWSWIVNAAQRTFKARWKQALWALSGAWLVVLLASWVLMKI